MKQLPNLFTLLNLVFGCIAIVHILQTNEMILTVDATGSSQVVLPENIAEGALFIYAAAIIDFLDGFLARLLRASSEMGKQLDSLSDVVSFGVAPGLIIYQLLRLSYAQQVNGLDVSFLLLLPAFLLPASAAWRLGKFNISSNQAQDFIGVPSPAAGLLIASFPLLMISDDSVKWNISPYFINKWVLYFIILLVSYLMVCNRRFLALKFNDYSFRNNWPVYILIVLSAISVFLFKWLAVPLIFIFYMLLSFFAKKTSGAKKNEHQETTDLTV